ncbi:MAG: NADH-quinone oxidoreductase subunit J [Verrucomicrobiota bacterium]|jgi:NADH-quinone oxidoreductase subunit J
MLNEIAFYLIAAVTLAFAVAAMALRQLVHCALCAAAAFAGLAMLYLQLDAEFVGFAQLLVYVGAIAILIVFAVLLTRADEILPGSRQSSPSSLMGIAAALLVLSGIALPVLSSPSLHSLPVTTAAAPVKSIGVELMTRYVLPLEMAGILLTAALLGAVVIAMREEPETKLDPRPPAPRRAETGEVVSLP